MEYIVITGVSTGIGYETARYMVEKGFHVFGSVRRQSDADKTKTVFGARFTPLLFDVRDENGVKNAANQVKHIVGNNGIKALINNAGITVSGPLMHLSIEDFRLQLGVNVIGVLSVTQAFLPFLRSNINSSQLPGRIINISSVSGKIAYPFMGAYAASKHALEAMSDSLRRELMLYGIDVVLIEPSFVFTPILNKAKEQLNSFQETDYATILKNAGPILEERSKSGMPVETMSQTIYEAITTDKPKARYPLPIKWLSRWYLPRFLPTRMIDSMIAKTFGITKN